VYVTDCELSEPGVFRRKLLNELVDRDVICASSATLSRKSHSTISGTRKAHTAQKQATPARQA